MLFYANKQKEKRLVILDHWRAGCAQMAHVYLYITEVGEDSETPRDKD